MCCVGGEGQQTVRPVVSIDCVVGGWLLVGVHVLHVSVDHEVCLQRLKVSWCRRRARVGRGCSGGDSAR